MTYYRLNDDIHAPLHRQLRNVMLQNQIISADRFTSSERYHGSGDLSIEADAGERFDLCFAAFDVPVISQRFADCVESIAEEEKVSGTEWSICFLTPLFSPLFYSSHGLDVEFGSLGRMAAGCWIPNSMD